jgi:hypothetical protein
MPSYDSNLFNVDPYYDDYSEDKKHLRIMFRPGFGVQARELTQLQTLLQNQIERFGSHIFEEGSIVLDGQITTNPVKCMRVTLAAGISHGDFVGTTIRNSTLSSGAYGRVVHSEGELSTDNNPVLFFEYLNGGTGFTSADSIAATASNSSQITAQITGSVQDAIVVSVDKGVRFVEGYFVLNDAQSIGAYNLVDGKREFASPTTSIGFAVNKEFVSSQDDNTLTDPAFGYYNYAAPGADRFTINMVLSQRGYTANDYAAVDNFSREGFVEFMRIVDGDVVKVEKYPDYAVLEDTLARRTYDESGNYTVVPFDLNIRGISGNSTTVKAELSPGKAYVFGYEFETQGVSKLNVSKSRTERSVDTRTFPTSVGPYTKVLFSGVTGSVGSVTDFGLDPILILVTGSSGQGDAQKRIIGQVGKARMRRVESYNTATGVHNLFLYDVAMTAGAEFSQVERVFLSGVTHCDRHLFTLTGGDALKGVLQDSDKSCLLWEIPDGSVAKSIDSVDLAYTYHASQSVSSFPHVTTLPIEGNPPTGFGFALGNDINFPNGEIVVFDQAGRVMSGTAATTENGILQMTIAGNASQSNRLFYMVSYDFDGAPGSSNSLKTKTLQTQSITLTGSYGSLTGDERGKTANTLYLNGLVDVKSVSSMTGSKDGIGVSILPYFSFDNGQRDDFYDFSRMTLNPGVTGITGPYTATIDVYTRSGNGFFAVNSYTGNDVSSDYIPTYTSNTTGKTYRLRDCIDFRPDRGITNGNVTQLQSNVTWIPTNTAANDNQFTYTHYLGRVDKIVLTRDREFNLITGIPAVNPVPPSDDPNAMTLYTLGVNPFTFGPNDVNIRLVENKRYTMRDIGDLEKRIEAIEYYTSLNLLEQDAKSLSIKDDVGDEMPKRGIIVDQFKGHVVADNTDKMFAASVDYENNELRPSFTSKNFGLTNGTAVNLTGSSSDAVYTIGYSSVNPEISNIVSSGTVKVNPFGVVSFLGNMTITPSSDVWYDETKKPKVRVNIEGENDNWEQNPNYGFGTRYNDWESIWFGKSLNEQKSNRPNTKSSSGLSAKVSGVAMNSLNSPLTPESIKKKIQEKSVVKDVLPIAREKDIAITAKGLKPDSGFYVYCDDVLVNDYCTGQNKTDSKGEITNLVFKFNFVNPNFAEQNFTVGRHAIRIIGTDILPVNTDTLIQNPSLWSMSADALYVVEGYYDTITESNTLSTRLATTKRKSAKSDKVISNLNEMLTSSGEIKGYQEPLCQTFYVDPNTYPSGFFLGFVDLYFSQKDSSTTIPVTVEVRPTLGGYPHPSKVMPFGSSTLYSGSVNTLTRIASGNTGYTRFAFSTPVYLLPGQEYSVCLNTNSASYGVFTSAVGSFALKANESDPNLLVAKQPSFRAIFKTQNAGKLTRSDNESLCMRIGICEFSIGTASTFTLTKSELFPSETDVYNTIRLNSSIALPEGCSVSCSIVNVGNIEPNKNVVPSSGYINLSGISTPVASAGNFVLSFASSNKYVSPIFDRERTSVTLVKNIVNNNSTTTVGLAQYNGELEPTNSGVTENNRAKARYISKRVTLEPGVDAENITVKMSLNNPKGDANTSSSVKVFVRAMPVGETDFSKVNYIELTTSDTSYSYSKDEFREVSFTNIGYTTLPKFTTFSIKVVMFGDPYGAVYPKVRNLRVVAT